MVVTTFAASEALAPRGLIDKRVDRVKERGPHTNAPGDSEQQQANASAQVSAMSTGVDVPSLGRRVHDLTVLSAIALLQLTWLWVLGYGLFSIMK